MVKSWADMVKCRPVDLGPSFSKRLLKLEAIIRSTAARHRFSDKEVLAWAERHDFQGSITDLRAAMDDARSSGDREKP